MARSARLRTLLPLLRSTLLITIVIVAGLTVLSEIGINIAPLLAGAGIVGVAIGFGSQKLVQDLITGIFLLLENAMQVGDTVTVSGLSGMVENLSVRTIRLRAGDGSVHIIPFSSVTSVTNVNRGLGNASVSVERRLRRGHRSGGRRADGDRRRHARPSRDLSAMMLSDLQLWGVDKVDGAAVTIAGQVVCTDSGPLGRAARIQPAHEAAVSGAWDPDLQPGAARSPCLPPVLPTAASQTAPGRREGTAHEHAQAAN